MSLYDKLNIDENSTPEEIKKAYYDLSKKHHPDRGGDPDVFNEINMAYAILIDDTKRERYDKTGDENQFVNNIKTEALQVIAGLFMKVLSKISTKDDVYNTDIIGIIKNSLTQAIITIEREVIDYNERKEQLHLIKERLSGKQSNILESMIDAELAGIERFQSEGKRKIEVREEAIIILNDVNYRFEAQELIQFYFASGSGTASTTA